MSVTKLKIGTTIYPLEYDREHRTYTIVESEEREGNKFTSGGLWYKIHADSLSDEHGYMFVSASRIDNENVLVGSYYTTIEAAKAAFDDFNETMAMLAEEDKQWDKEHFG